jgi:tetratricopeptide (TPR) repeat protein
MSASRSVRHSLAWTYGSVSTPSPRDELNPDGLYEQAMRLQREGKLEAALGVYSQVVLADDEFAEAYYGRASVCYQLGNCDQAINDCNRALELRRGFFEAHFVRGAAYWGKAAQVTANDPCLIGYCEQVISDCTYVLDYKPRTGLAYFNRGMAYWSLGNKPMAKHDLENAVVLIKDSGWRAEAEGWLKELKKPRLLSRYEADNWHRICGR